MKKKKIILWIPVILWMIVIFCLSAQTADESSKTSGIFSKILEYFINTVINPDSESLKNELIDKCHFIVRKLAHFTEYAILGILSSAAVKNYEKLSSIMKKIIPAVLCLLYAVSDEIHQYFVPGRSCQFRDVMIDFSGSVFGIIIFTLFLLLIRKRKLRKSEK